MPYLGRDVELHHDSNNKAFIFNWFREWKVFSRESLPHQARLPRHLLGMMATESSEVVCPVYPTSYLGWF